MTIHGLMMDPVSNTPIVILKDVGDCPIWVGVYEANALEMEKVSTPASDDHNLVENVLMGLETQVHKVVVTELKEDTFYAVISAVWTRRRSHQRRFASVGCAGTGVAGGIVRSWCR